MADLLKSGGVYSLAAISMVIAAFLYRAREADRKDHVKAMETARLAAAAQLETFRTASAVDAEAKNTKLFDLAERMAGVIATSDSNQARVIEVVKELLSEIRSLRK